MLTIRTVILIYQDDTSIKTEDRYSGRAIVRNIRIEGIPQAHYQLTFELEDVEPTPGSALELVNITPENGPRTEELTGRLHNGEFTTGFNPAFSDSMDTGSSNGSSGNEMRSWGRRRK